MNELAYWLGWSILVLLIVILSVGGGGNTLPPHCIHLWKPLILEFVSKFGILLVHFGILSVQNEPTQWHFVPKYYTISHVSDQQTQTFSGLGLLISPCRRQEYRKYHDTYMYLQIKSTKTMKKYFIYEQNTKKIMFPTQKCKIFGSAPS